MISLPTKPSLRRRMRLAEAPVGIPGRVCELQGEAGACARLRELGFCESAEVERIAGQGTLICRLCGIRMAINGQAANHILVEFDSEVPSAKALSEGIWDRNPWR